MPEPRSLSDLRLVFTSGDLPLGGATSFLGHIGGEVVRRGGRCTILTFASENPFLEEFARLGIDIRAGDNATIFEDRMSQLNQALADLRPTVLVASLGSNAFEVLRYAPPGVVRAGIIHGDEAIVYDLLKTYAPWMDVIIGVSEHIVEQVRAIPELHSKRIVYLTCGVPSLGSFNTPSSVGEPIRILYNGRLEESAKRVRLFPEIYRTLKRLNIPFRWTLVGDGPSRGALEAAMPSEPGAEVDFKGIVAFTRVAEVIQENDIYLLASSYEGLPLSLLEAMGVGLVPVVSDLASGIRQVVLDSCGLRVDPSDTEGYARAIAHLHYHRDELASKSVECRQRVLEGYTVAAMTDRWDKEIFSRASVAPPPWPENPGIQTPAWPMKWPQYYSPLLRWPRRWLKARQAK